jgi:uncharacterized membrane protein YdbT with pleckstrin-like domain
VASYVESSLSAGESIQYTASLSVWPYWKRILLAIGLLLAPLAHLPRWTPLLGILLFLSLYTVLESVELAITNRRIIVKAGLVKRKTSELYLNRVEGVEVEQTVLERMLGYGTVNIRGVGTEIAPVAHISKPLAFRKAFFEAADAMMGSADEGGPFADRPAKSTQESAGE